MPNAKKVAIDTDKPIFMDKKHLELLDFLLVQLCKRESFGIMFRHILTDYKNLTGIVLTHEEKTNFIELYKNVYFTKENIDRLKITQSARQIINEFGSLTEYFNEQERLRLQEEIRLNEEQAKIERLENAEKLKTQAIQDIKAIVENHSSSKTPKPKSIINRLANNPIIQIMSILVIIYSFLKIIEVVFCVDIPII